MPWPSIQFFPQYYEIGKDIPSRPQYLGIDDSPPIKHMKSDISDQYETLDIDLSLLDPFDNNNIIELGLRDQINKYPLPQWQNISNTK